MKSAVRAYTLRLYPNPGKAKEAFGILLEQRAWLYEFVRQHLATGEESWTVSAAGLGTVADRALRRAHAIIKAGRNSSIATGDPFNGPRSFPLLAEGTVEKAAGTTFDYWIKMRPGPRMPANSHRALNKALRTGGTLANTAEIAVDKRGRLIARVFVHFTVPETKDTGDYIGVDVGVNTGVASSDGYLSKSLRPLLRKTERRNAERRRQKHAHKIQSKRSPVKQFLDREARRLVASAKGGNKTLAIESLKALGNLQPSGSIGPWARCHLGQRVLLLAEETGVTVIQVWPAYGSQTCPECDYCHAQNRRGSYFECLRCGYISNADSVAARNNARKAAGTFPTWERGKAGIETWVE